MKRIPAVLAAVVAMAFVATVAMAEDTTAPAAAAPAKAAPAKTMSTTSTTHHHSSSSSKSTKTPKTDLNTASKEDLMKLPGVDDATADKIIASRPYTSKSELVKKNVLTQEEMKKIEAHVMTKAPAKEAAPKK